MTMAAGVETRVPFLDSRLVEVAARIKPHVKMKKMHPKWILKKALMDTLPQEILFRPKTGFGVPLRDWFPTHIEPQIRSSMLSGDTNSLFDSKKVLESMHINNKKEDLSYPLFSAYCILSWFNSIKGAPSEHR